MNRTDSITGVAFVLAMEMHGKPDAMARYALKLAETDLRSIEGVSIYQNWRAVWEEIFGAFDDTGTRKIFYAKDMHKVHAELCKRLAAKGLMRYRPR
jgi:hypothetical protein